MKIISWNVNGIRAVAKKWLKAFVAEHQPDILCLQETKAFEEQFLKDVGNLEGYTYVWHTGTRAGYAGTVIFYRDTVEVIDTKNDFDEVEHFHSDGRVTELEFFYSPDSETSSKWQKEKQHIVLLNAYFPNGGMRADGTDMVPYKLDFYDHMIHYTKKLVAEGKQVIVTGDFNICHTEIDIARPKENENSVGFLPVERAKVSEFLEAGFVDVWRKQNPDAVDVYSWWSYRGWARARNVGWRIDYFTVNEGFFPHVKNMKYMCDILGSDHCPILLEV